MTPGCSCVVRRSGEASLALIGSLDFTLSSPVGLGPSSGAGGVFRVYSVMHRQTFVELTVCWSLDQSFAFFSREPATSDSAEHQ